MNKKLVVRLFLFGAIALLYLAMLSNTNIAINDVKDIMYGKVETSVTNNSPLRMYNRKDDFGTTSVDVKITRLLVLHNFFDGYIWVRYTHQGFDANGDLTYGSWNIPSRWKIHKENGKWHVVEILEAP